MTVVGNAKDLLGLLVLGIIAFFFLGLLLTLRGPVWTHDIAAWMMVPGIFTGITAFWVAIAKAASRK